MDYNKAAQQIVENAADWGWNLDTEQDLNDAAYSYVNDGIEDADWTALVDALRTLCPGVGARG